MFSVSQWISVCCLHCLCMHANFDRLARVYRFLEFGIFGHALWRRRVAYLHRLDNVKRVLMAGEGDGRFLAEFLRMNPYARVDYVDRSRKMLELARKRSRGHLDRVRFFHADLRELATLPDQYDAIVTHFFLDCFSESDLASVIAVMARSAVPGAFWVISEFNEGPPGSRLFIRALYLFFRVTAGLRTTRLPGHQQLLSATGFRLLASEKSLFGLLTSEIRQQGGRNSAPLGSTSD